MSSMELFLFSIFISTHLSKAMLLPSNSSTLQLPSQDTVLVTGEINTVPTHEDSMWPSVPFQRDIGNGLTINITGVVEIQVVIKDSDDLQIQCIRRLAAQSVQYQPPSGAAGNPRCPPDCRKTWRCARGNHYCWIIQRQCLRRSRILLPASSGRDQEITSS